LRTFASFRNCHSGESILVCGCGDSLNQIEVPVGVLTIGVNDVGRRFDPTYLVVVNPEGHFSRDRFTHIRHSRANVIFTQYGKLPVPEERRVLVRLGQYGGTDLNRADVLHYTRNSPYVAVCLAVHMGARRIGLVGVDFGAGSVYGSSAQHPLAADLNRINAEYAALAKACRARGIELVNLSPISKITSLPTLPLTAMSRPSTEGLPAPQKVTCPEIPSLATIVIVDYDFLTCGRVFGDGLTRAAAALGVHAETFLWNDASLPARVESLRPDLMIIVHGRHFSRHWGERFGAYNTAVWLLDEPYEVDDTARWSSCYGTVFVNDRGTLPRHRNAHYLPVCYDDQTHCDTSLARPYRVGFIGGGNAQRERYLEALATAGLLDYVVGGPWASGRLREVTRAQSISPAEVARRYQETQIVVNVFRERHHFNHQKIPATAPNPRILEALACGALVVSERRTGLADFLPTLPQFDGAAELVELVTRYLGDPEKLCAFARACRAGLGGHTYRERLATMLEVAIPAVRPAAERSAVRRSAQPVEDTSRRAVPPGWRIQGAELEVGDDAGLVLRPAAEAQTDRSYADAGLVSEHGYLGVDLRFSVRFGRDAVLVAKIQQCQTGNLRSDFCRLVATATGSYVASGRQILMRLALACDRWIQVRLRCVDSWLEIWADDILRGRFRQRLLAPGYGFVGTTGGAVALRGVSIEGSARTGRRVVAPRPAPRLPAFRPKQSVAPVRTPRLNLPDLGSASRRNLIYHVWPRCGSNWRWNIEQLLGRIELFNGKRIVGIVEDERTDSAAKVMDLLAGHGCEFLVRANAPAAEAVTFPEMLERVASTAADEVTFYGHAKGARHGPPCPPNVQRWCEAMYAAALDDWPTVHAQLSHFAMTGSFRMVGRFATHRNAGDWHYSGTFFWMRHTAVFSRGWREVAPSYYGVEAWPGRLFGKEETGCLLFDDLGPPLPYVDAFWSRRGRLALREWHASRRGVAVPPDLTNPEPLEGHAEPRLEHKPEEFGWWLELIKAQGVRRLLVIGSPGGGAEWHTARVFRAAGMDIEITTIAQHPSAALESTYEQARAAFRQRLRLIKGDSGDSTVRERLDTTYDAVFIDGEHGYKHVRADFVLAQSRCPKLIGLHDIVDSDWHAGNSCCVSRLWREVASERLTAEKSGAIWGGIGVVLESPTPAEHA
jgi:hypothetical protein